MSLFPCRWQSKRTLPRGLKADDQMEWLRRMNNIWNRAEEIVLHELIYV